MRQVKVKTKELLDIIKANREKHIAEYKEACAGYKAKALDWLKKCFTKLRQETQRMNEDELQRVNAFLFDLDVLVSHEKDYDQVVRMLELSVEEETTLQTDEFSCYVMDEWKWKQQWQTTNQSYK